MHLQAGEYVYKVYYKHLTPYIFLLIKSVFASIPFYFIWIAFLGFFQSSISTAVFFGITIFFAVIVTYLTFTFFYDRLILTNYRIIHVDWVNLFVRDQSAAEFSDIQRIYTREKGILAAIPFFDYGIINIETASATVTIKFEDAPDPERMKQFISDYMLLHQNDQQKHHTKHNVTERSQGGQA